MASAELCGGLRAHPTYLRCKNASTLPAAKLRLDRVYVWRGSKKNCLAAKMWELLGERPAVVLAAGSITDRFPGPLLRAKAGSFLEEPKRE